MSPGELVRRTRKEQGLTLAQLGDLAGYSAAQVSRYERGVSLLTDVTVLRGFAAPSASRPRRLVWLLSQTFDTAAPSGQPLRIPAFPPLPWGIPHVGRTVRIRCGDGSCRRTSRSRPPPRQAPPSWPTAGHRRTTPRWAGCSSPGCGTRCSACTTTSPSRRGAR
ncbi:helix-turn-helix domain-containing protein [Streptomyces sp. NPDC001678]|uniref:helix-turn-helix domain-containing protein n=1 Tax=Streptomyces sp. NPDC001678 TaxID=3364599 RepID=UPI00367AA3FF